MAGPADILNEIHRLRGLAQELQQRIDFAPKQLKAQQGIVGKREDEVKGGQEAVKKLKVAIHEHEVSIKAAQQQIKKYEQQLNDIHSKKEYDALKHEIAGVEVKIRGIEDETLVVMMQLEERAALLPGLEEAVKKAKAELTAVEREFQDRLAGWTQQRDEANQKIVAQEAMLPEDMRPQYDRMVKAMGADALAAVVGRTCMACHTDMTTQYYHNVLLRQFVVCRNCGRMLYLKE